MLLVNLKMKNGTIIKEARVCKPYSFIPIENRNEINDILRNLDKSTGYGNNIQFVTEACSGFIDRSQIDSFIINER